MQNSFELLWLFQLFYHLNGCLLLTDRRLPVPDGERPPGAKKISLKRFYELTELFLCNFYLHCTYFLEEVLKIRRIV